VERVACAEEVRVSFQLSSSTSTARLLLVAASPSNLAEEVEVFEDFLTAVLFLLINCLWLPSVSKQVRTNVAE
jgi:hypothetical protein